MKLKVLETALETIQVLRPVMLRIRRVRTQPRPSAFQPRTRTRTRTRTRSLIRSLTPTTALAPAKHRSRVSGVGAALGSPTGMTVANRDGSVAGAGLVSVPVSVSVSVSVR
jgi:hypothetical protein